MLDISILLCNGMVTMKNEDSNDPKWSEPIIVLGRGVPHPSRTYKCVCYCVAGIGETNRWLRLYPVRRTPELIQNFDIVQVAIRKEQAEKHRPETRKIYLDPPPKKVDHISDEKKRLQILEDNLESGTFMHDKSWYGIKSLGLIQPIYPEFEIEEKRVMVRYKCDAPRCRGHINEVMDWSIINQRGRRGHIDHPKELKEKLLFLQRQHLLKRQQLWFVMGTHRLHPSSWLLIEFHATKTQKSI